MAERYPLMWPLGWPRTARPEHSRFECTFDGTRKSLVRELELMGAREIIISTNIPLRKDGYPYASYKDPADKGVAVYYMLGGECFVIPCDRWDSVKDNLRAIEKTIDALRGIERWGAGEIMKRAFTGFKALPEPGQGTGNAWWDVLGVTSDAESQEIYKAYKLRAKESHPDTSGGSREKWDELEAAYQQALAALKGREELA